MRTSPMRCLQLACLASAYAYSPSIPRTSKSFLPAATDADPVSRRVWMSTTAGMLAGSTVLLPPDAHADEATVSSGLTDYKDPACKFSVKVPSDWEYSIQELPDRRKIALYIEPNSNKKTLFFMAYTPVRDDFTSLGSFGSVDQVAQATILPKGKLLGEDNESVMLSAESKQSAYIFDYKQKVAGQPETHFRTIFSLATGATGGAGAVLVTLTAQCPETDYDKYKPLFDTIIGSYRAK